jgi:hypothetical protein
MNRFVDTNSAAREIEWDVEDGSNDRPGNQNTHQYNCCQVAN